MYSGVIICFLQLLVIILYIRYALAKNCGKTTICEVLNTTRLTVEHFLMKKFISIENRITCAIDGAFVNVVFYCSFEYLI